MITECIYWDITSQQDGQVESQIARPYDFPLVSAPVYASHILSY